MQAYSVIAAAAVPTVAVIRNIRADQLNAPTPCAEYDVRGLLNHMLYTGPALASAARKELLAPPVASERDMNLTEGDYAGKLVSTIDSMVVGWSDPTAWDGMTGLGGPQMPASMVGGIVLIELVVHGWDLARATGQNPSWDEAVLTVLHRQVEASADQGRNLGMYAHAVDVAGNAPILARTLALTGRDPRWVA